MVADLLKKPVSGRDYPRSWEQFLDWVPDEGSCVAFLERIRWPEGFVCPRCGEADEAYRVSRGRLMCRHCRYQCTVTAGTVFEKTRTPLQSWLAAVWYITNQKQGVTALGLQRVLDLGSYQTAWAMLHRLRRAMVRHGRERLHDQVEVDETYVGGPPPSAKKRRRRKGRKPKKRGSKKVIVAVAVELRQPHAFGRIRLRRLPDASATSLLPFVCDSVRPGSEVYTDGSAAYRDRACPAGPAGPRQMR